MRPQHRPQHREVRQAPRVPHLLGCVVAAALLVCPVKVLAQASSAASTDRTQLLERRLAEVEARLARTLFLVAAQQLQLAAQSGRPFERELAALRDAAPPGMLGNGARETLASHAGRGVLPIAELRANLQAVSAAAIARGGEAGWIDWATRTGQDTLARFGIADATPGGPAALALRRMDALLARGQLGPALVDAEALPAAAQSALAGWLAQARARAAVDQALNELLLRGMQPIPPGRPPG